MRSKLLVRELSALNTDKHKVSRVEEKFKEQDDVKENLKELTECIKHMTLEIKEMKMFHSV